MLCNSGQILKNLDGICQAVACNVAGSLDLMNSAAASHPVERENSSFIGVFRHSPLCWEIKWLGQ